MSKNFLIPAEDDVKVSLYALKGGNHRGHRAKKARGPPNGNTNSGNPPRNKSETRLLAALDFPYVVPLLSCQAYARRPTTLARPGLLGGMPGGQGGREIWGGGRG